MLLSPGSWTDYNMMVSLPQEFLPQSMDRTWNPPVPAGSAQSSNDIVATISPELHQMPSFTSPTARLSSEGLPSTIDDEFLLRSFLQMLMPPILASVEIGPKWSATREFFASMASESSMVRLAAMAFSAFQLTRSQAEMDVDYKPFYDSAYRELRDTLAAGDSPKIHQKELKYILATSFLLTYADLLTQKLPQAHANLKEAYNLIQNSEKDSFTAAERRLISWIRLLDARAVSTAGGEGLFLMESDDTVFASSPTPTQADDSAALDTEIEEILFDILYHPGIVFFQKVQSFVGRVTKIDPWHRSRGTVEDETEVMAIAAQISQDLHALYRQRPALMDHAVAGNLTEKHLAKNLAQATTRSFRTYLANYYASFIHLHRVAYRLFPRTKDLENAIENVKRLSHLMNDTDEPLPVNLLWPLLMWGSEEEDQEERKWISKTIRGLENVATNAKFTADLLEELQKRQDETRQRMDIRSVSQDFFPSHFAIV
ncbi:hypothetical protein FQN55_007369 [Onygenales sp. PD_40]|nr:hypothetical protein FQN55_007369 [Onygenales sp. PD_40]KAK2778763.1 hypothetical protein FQN52_002678 [Onygenales sp. PD_12]KAK2788485.1 hypothetical protein FQN53_003631 [Emmonsiellopsis sp. PD_33]